MDYLFTDTCFQTTAATAVFTAVQEQHEDWQERDPAWKDVTGP